MFMHRLVMVAVVAVFVSAAQADTIFVDDDNCPGPGSGTERDPYCSIQTAIFNAVNTDVIIVAIGTYLESIDFLGKAITVRSTDPLDRAVVVATVIDAQRNGSVVTCASGEGPDSVLEGFTITGGSAVFGGGMVNIDSSPTVTNCTFSGNAASSFGGGMGNDHSNLTVTNCTFSGNSATGTGGGMENFLSNPTLTGCTFSGNTANFGGGMSNSIDSSPTVTNCTFSGNTATFGGGGMDNFHGSSPTVTNCTFSENTAGNDGGGMSNYNSFAIVTNCILWGDSPDEMSNDSSLPVVSYSDVQGGLPPGAVDGGGNIDADPLFVDPVNADYRLQTGSPCADAGNNWGVPIDANDYDEDGVLCELFPVDLDGNPRFNADEADFDPGCGVPVVVDMGAYEYQFDPVDQVTFADLNGDDVVGAVDLLGLLVSWGPCGKGCCLADLNIDGTVGASDLLALLVNWGPCP